MRAAEANDLFDLAKAGRATGRRHRLGLGMPQINRIQQRRHRRADRGPVGREIVARADQRLAQRLQARCVVQFSEPGPAQQRAQGRI